MRAFRTTYSYLYCPKRPAWAKSNGEIGKKASGKSDTPKRQGTKQGIKACKGKASEISKHRAESEAQSQTACSSRNSTAPRHNIL